MKTHHKHVARRAGSRRAGFSLLELIVVISILAVLAGSAVPLATRAIERASRKATIAELDLLAAAGGEFFFDTGSLPVRVGELLIGSGLSGWTGPYVRIRRRDPRSGLADSEVDGWSNPYRITHLGPSSFRIESPGPDGEFGLLDDYSVHIDVTAIRRSRTLQRLGTLNQAIANYNRDRELTDPLPADFSRLLVKLVTSGNLPAVEPWAEDGWGKAFVCDPLGATPVVRVASIELSR